LSGAGQESSTIEIGRIGRAHGTRGDVKVALHWAGSQALHHVSTVVLRRPGDTDATWRVERARPTPKGYLLKLEGIDDRTAAEAIRGASVLVDRGELPELEPGEYYLSDLVGLRVVSPAGPVGEVVEVRSHPSVDTIIIRGANGALFEQPLSPPWLDVVDTAARELRLANTDGLIDA
jgi:16S rRNA processing protein RimM